MANKAVKRANTEELIMGFGPTQVSGIISSVSRLSFYRLLQTIVADRKLLFVVSFDGSSF